MWYPTLRQGVRSYGPWFYNDDTVVDPRLLVYVDLARRIPTDIYCAKQITL